MIADDRRVRRDPEVLWRRVHDGVLLLAPGAAEPVLASGAAASVWLHLGDGGTTAGELVAAATASGLPPEAPADGGVGAAVAMLREGGLVRLDGGPG